MREETHQHYHYTLGYQNTLPIYLYIGCKMSKRNYLTSAKFKYGSEKERYCNYTTKITTNNYSKN